jgi:biotin operon repressor
MEDNGGDDLVTRLASAAIDSAAPGDEAALIERLFAALPAESQERLVRELLTKVTSTPEPAEDEPAVEAQSRGAPLMWDSGNRLPIRDIGPWRMCCRMMADVDQAATVDEFDAGVPAEVFGALGDETRIKIIRLLQDDERRLEDIAKTLGVPQSTLSHHLRVLRTAGLIEVDRRGRSSFYSLARSAT